MWLSKHELLYKKETMFQKGSYRSWQTNVTTHHNDGSTTSRSYIATNYEHWKPKKLIEIHRITLGIEMNVVNLIWLIPCSVAYISYLALHPTLYKTTIGVIMIGETIRIAIAMASQSTAEVITNGPGISIFLPFVHSTLMIIVSALVKSALRGNMASLVFTHFFMLAMTCQWIMMIHPFKFIVVPFIGFITCIPSALGVGELWYYLLIYCAASFCVEVWLGKEAKMGVFENILSEDEYQRLKSGYDTLTEEELMALDTGGNAKERAKSIVFHRLNGSVDINKI